MISLVLPGLPLQPQMLCSNPPTAEDRMTPLYKFSQLISYPTDKFFPHSTMPSNKGKWKKAFDNRNRDSKGRLSYMVFIQTLRTRQLVYTATYVSRLSPLKTQ